MHLSAPSWGLLQKIVRDSYNYLKYGQILAPSQFLSEFLKKSATDYWARSGLCRYPQYQGKLYGRVSQRKDSEDTMSVSFSSNVQALKLSNKLDQTASQLSSVYERLSTGSRINKASDDPAGLALAEKLNADSRMMTVALRNANDAMSLTTMANSALAEISNILRRMSELALQGQSTSYSTTARSTLQSEFVALGSEVDRISATTNFNSIQLLSNSSTQVAQVGIASDSFSRIDLPSVLATLAFLGLGSGSTLTYSLTGTTANFGVSASRTAYSAIQTAMSTVDLQRGTVGATSSRLSAAISYLTVARENVLAAEADVRDADVAADATELVRLQVLQQAQTSLLAQANQIPAQALALIAS
jgi:flagellin